MERGVGPQTGFRRTLRRGLSGFFTRGGVGNSVPSVTGADRDAEPCGAAGDRPALAERAFRLLASSGACGADPAALLAHELGLSDEDARRTLCWLREHRLFDPRQGRVNAPESAVLDVLGAVGGSLSSMVEEVERQRRTVCDLLELAAGPLAAIEPDRVEVVRFTDRARLRRWLDERAGLNRHEAAMTYPSFPPSRVLHESLRIDRELLARGVQFRMLSSRTAARRPPVRAYLNDLHTAGAHIRVSHTVPLRMLVIDNEVVITPDPESEPPSDLVLRGRVIARAYLALFECLWSAASKYPTHPEADAAGEQAHALDSTRISLLRAMAAGAKDEAVARQLGCSDRTLRRLIAQTLDELGVRSRFAAGVRAAQLGLLD